MDVIKRSTGWLMAKPVWTVVLVGCILTGCNGPMRRPNAREKGVLAGGALGAGLGAIVGNQVGNSGAGIAIGSALGAVSGGIIGNEIERESQETEAQNERIDRNDRILAENRRLLEELRAGGLDVSETGRGIVANLPDVLFEFDSARLTPEARQVAGQIARAARGVKGRRLSVEGHTDSVGTAQYNQRLSQQRARAVADALIDQGVSSTRIRTRGLGESRPIASNSSNEGRRRNRRVEVIFENR